MSLFNRKPRTYEFGAVLVEVAKLELGPDDILAVKVPSTGSNRSDREVCRELSHQLRGLYLPRTMAIVGVAELLVVKQDGPAAEPLLGPFEHLDSLPTLADLKTFDSVVLENEPKSAREKALEPYRAYLDEVEKQAERGAYGCPHPHCDELVLHARGKCVYCDEWPGRQALRLKMQIEFTGESHRRPGWMNCPAEILRPVEKIELWGGNRPK